MTIREGSRRLPIASGAIPDLIVGSPNAPAREPGRDLNRALETNPMSDARRPAQSLCRDRGRDRPLLFRGPDARRRAVGRAPADRRDAPPLALGRPLRPEPERRDGLEGRRGRPRPVPDPEHPGGLARPDGTPIALGYHTGHWEIGLLVQEAAEELRRSAWRRSPAWSPTPATAAPRGRPGMMDSLPYRNDAAIVFRRLIRSLPRRKGVLGVATCDKGLPAMMLALAGVGSLPGVIVPGGVTLPPGRGRTRAVGGPWQLPVSCAENGVFPVEEIGNCRHRIGRGTRFRIRIKSTKQ